MAIKITKEISTDAGNTNSAYIRIVNYSLSKEGLAEFKLQIFKSEEDAAKSSLRPGSDGSIDPCKNKEIGETLQVSLLKKVDEIVMIKQKVETTILEKTEIDSAQNENGEITTIVKEVPKIQIEEKEVETIVQKTIVDFSTIASVDIFSFGYTELKKKLSDLYGQENIKDC